MAQILFDNLALLLGEPGFLPVEQRRKDFFPSVTYDFHPALVRPVGVFEEVEVHPVARAFGAPDGQAVGRAEDFAAPAIEDAQLAKHRVASG